MINLIFFKILHSPFYCVRRVYRFVHIISLLLSHMRVCGYILPPSCYYYNIILFIYFSIKSPVLAAAPDNLFIFIFIFFYGFYVCIKHFIVCSILQIFYYYYEIPHKQSNLLFLRFFTLPTDLLLFRFSLRVGDVLTINYLAIYIYTLLFFLFYHLLSSLQLQTALHILYFLVFHKCIDSSFRFLYRFLHLIVYYSINTLQTHFPF